MVLGITWERQEKLLGFSSETGVYVVSLVVSAGGSMSGRFRVSPEATSFPSIVPHQQDWAQGVLTASASLFSLA